MMMDDVVHYIKFKEICSLHSSSEFLATHSLDFNQETLSPILVCVSLSTQELIQ